jgi:hypothetical protein
MPEVDNLFLAWNHIHPFLSTRGPQEYKWEQCTETPRQFIKNNTKLGLLLQICSYITQFYLTKSVINEKPGTAFAWLIVHYQV